MNKRRLIDANNIVEKEIGGCKVRLLFSMDSNVDIERKILDNLMLVFDARNKSYQEQARA